jgi:hypothetical protein
MLFTASCQTERISQTQLQLARYSLKKADLPSGWKFTGKSWDVDFGGESYAVTYEMDMHIFITHEVSIHASQDQAQEAYKEWEGDWFVSTNLQPDAPYSPLDQDDDYRYECKQIKPVSPLKVCFYLQRHDEMISFVKINLDNRNRNNPTLEEVNDILDVLDKRLNEVVIEK